MVFGFVTDMVTSISPDDMKQLLGQLDSLSQGYILSAIPSMSPGGYFWTNLPDGTYLLFFEKTDGTMLYIHTDVQPSQSLDTVSYVYDQTTQAVIQNAQNLVSGIGTVLSWTPIILIGIAAFILFSQRNK